jgi:hypothetical protein
VSLEQAAAELFVSVAELETRSRELPGPLRLIASLGAVGRASYAGVHREALCVVSQSWRNRPTDCP